MIGEIELPKVMTEKELQQREKMVLDVSCQIIKEQGFSGLTMDKIVAGVPFSKGSLYKQFNSAQEVLLALTNSGAPFMIDLIERAHSFNGNSRERYLARSCACFVYALLYPIHYFSELEAIGLTVREKATESRLNEGYKLMNQFKILAEKFVENGIASGELNLTPDTTIARIAGNSWTSEFGLTSYSLTPWLKGDKFPLERCQKLEADLIWMVNIFLDGLGWKPMSSEFDYQQSWDRIKTELFLPELRLIGLASA